MGLLVLIFGLFLLFTEREGPWLSAFYSHRKRKDSQCYHHLPGLSSGHRWLQRGTWEKFWLITAFQTLSRKPAGITAWEDVHAVLLPLVFACGPQLAHWQLPQSFPVSFSISTPSPAGTGGCFSKVRCAGRVLTRGAKQVQGIPLEWWLRQVPGSPRVGWSVRAVRAVSHCLGGSVQHKG